MIPHPYVLAAVIMIAAIMLALFFRYEMRVTK
jgi:hypothetical protein